MAQESEYNKELNNPEIKKLIREEINEMTCMDIEEILDEIYPFHKRESVPRMDWPVNSPRYFIQKI